MIKGLHVTIFSPEAEALRAFLRDKLELPYTDAGGGWLIFDAPEADLGCHPTNMEGIPADRKDQTYQEISFYCDDINETVSRLKERGVEFTSDVIDEGYALTTHFRMPGNLDVLLYQPHYAKNPSS